MERMSFYINPADKMFLGFVNAEGVYAPSAMQSVLLYMLVLQLFESGGIP